MWQKDQTRAGHALNAHTLTTELCTPQWVFEEKKAFIVCINFSRFFFAEFYACTLIRQYDPYDPKWVVLFYKKESN